MIAQVEKIQFAPSEGRSTPFSRLLYAANQLDQPVFFFAGRIAGVCAGFRQVHRLIRIFQSVGIFILHIQSHREPEDGDRIRLLRISVNRFFQLIFRGRPLLGVEIERAQNRIGFGLQEAFIGGELFRRNAGCWKVGIDRGERPLGILSRLRKSLILIYVGVTGTLGQNLGYSEESLGVIRIESEDLLRHGEHLVGVIGLLVTVHRRLIEQGPQFAVRKFRGKIIGGFFLRGRIGQRSRGFVGFKLCLGLGLRWTLARGGGGLSGRGGLRRRLVLGGTAN